MDADLLGTVMSKCPATGDAVCVGSHMRRSEFDRLEEPCGDAECPSCHGFHHWQKQDVWLQVN